MRRRHFLRTSVLAGAGLSVACKTGSASSPGPGGPRVVSTWGFGLASNAAAFEILEGGGSALDAAERGVMVAEADAENQSVGYGGLPNRDGVVELDAAIMDGDRLEAGAVAAVRDIMHPVAVARKVMEQTPHVLLVGDGARRFAIDHGFPVEDLLTPEARQRWETEGRVEEPNLSGHDTIGMVTLDREGHMAASCTTSGLAWKLPGRVGDSPLIGHGLYCDSSVGGAVATGVGEELIKVCGSYQVVEFMRQGVEPEEAVRRVIDRMIARDAKNRNEVMGLIALRNDGTAGYASTVDGFQVAVSGVGVHEVVDAPHMF